MFLILAGFMCKKIELMNILEIAVIYMQQVIIEFKVLKNTKIAT